MWPHAPASTAGHHPEAVELHLFVPQRDGSRTSDLVEDDGLTFALREGALRRTTSTVTRDGGRVLVEAVASGDGFPEHRRESFVLVVHGAAPAAVVVDGTRVPADEQGRFPFANSGSGFGLELRL